MLCVKVISVQLFRMAFIKTDRRLKPVRTQVAHQQVVFIRRQSSVGVYLFRKLLRHCFLKGLYRVFRVCTVFPVRTVLQEVQACQLPLGLFYPAPPASRPQGPQQVRVFFLHDQGNRFRIRSS